MAEKKFQKDLDYKGKRIYLCPPKPRGIGKDLRLEILKRQLGKKKIFFEKACRFKKKLYFCTRFKKQTP